MSFKSIVNRIATPLHHLVDTIWWMEVRYNFVYVFMTIFDAIFLSGEVQFNGRSIENILEYR